MWTRFSTLGEEIIKGRMRNRFFLLLLWLVGSVFSVAERPNILIIFTDDQGFYDVSYVGAKDIETPAIDALAASGMRFDNFYANCPVCSPSRAALQGLGCAGRTGQSS